MLALLASIISIAQLDTVDPWPLERQDRYATGRAIMGLPANQYVSPWRFREYGDGFITSFGPSFAADGNGYFGRWVNNTLRRFDPVTGAITGTVPTGHFVHCTPAITPSHIVISTDNDNGAVMGVNASGLFLDWLNNTGYISHSPNIGPEGDVAYTRIGPGIVGRYALTTGAVVWTRNGFGAPDGQVVFTRDDLKVIVAHANSITALNWSDGTTAWTYDSGSKTGAPGVAPDGTIIFGNEAGRVVAVNPNGTLKWTRFTTQKVDAPPAFGANGDVYIPSNDWALYAFRVSDGLPQWNYLTNHWINQPAVVDHIGRIYVQNRIGYIYCLTPSGQLLWTQRVGDDARGPMTFGPDGTLYVPYAGGGVQGGLSAIRFDSPPLTFEFNSVGQGLSTSGNNASLTTSDGNYFGVRSFTRRPAPDNLQVTFQATSAKRELDSLVTKTNLTLRGVSSAKCAVEVFNVSSGQWQPNSTKVLLTQNSATTINLTFPGDPTNYVQLGLNRILMRFRIYLSHAPSQPWGIDIDELSGRVVPRF